MSEIIEVVFENISAEVGGLVLRDIINASSGLVELKCGASSLIHSGERGVLLPANVDAITGNLQSLRVSSQHKLCNVGVRMFRHDGLVDVELNWNTDAASDEDSIILSVFEFSKSLARNRGVKSFYGGIEPAVDEETRFFTGAKMGPLALKNLSQGT